MTTPSNPNWPSEPDRGAVPPAQPPSHPGAYGYPGYPIRRSTNGFAIASLVLGIVWIYWLGSILALIFGYVARRQIRERDEGGDGLAVAGIVLGWVGIGILGLFVLFFLLHFLPGF